MEKNSDDFASVIQKAMDKALKERGNVNILIAGKTGVGKSTLINAVFQQKLATTGQGRPVTPNVREISKEGVPVRIFDTRGLEVANFKETIQAVEKLIKDRNSNTDPNKHIHVAWICILEGSSRVEEAESQLAEMLAKYVPTIAVITQAMSNKGFKNTVQELLPKVRNVVRVRAEEFIFEEEGYKLPIMGLKELVDLTMEVVPEGQKNAFVAAQRISLDFKTKNAHTIVAAAAVTAGGIGATPVPFTDAIAIVPIQVGMLAGITVAWGLPSDITFLSTLISGAITGAGATIAGQMAARAGIQLLGDLLKLIPGPGSIVGGVVNGATAAVLTTAFGEAYIATLYLLTKDNPDKEPTAEEIRNQFLKQLKKGNNK
ncbi:YcjF family protein [Floridanema aerugineum]|uniref:YcjF family protein n=1 Tax=Floridaenema aerugineum BLCC-F46 TaxID=3153654 RepID=A0ABV4XEY5_9CYAN